MLYIVLLHYPVYNKEGRVVTTSIANMDIHDIARTAKTYAVKRFYIVNPIEEQRKLAETIVNHWRNGYGAEFNDDRRAAFELIFIKESLQSVIDDIAGSTGLVPRTVATGANISGNVLKFAELRKLLLIANAPYLVIFGTGSGIADEVVGQADYRLEPIKGCEGYNHLAVRSAAAIILDRMMGN
ncbi:MAG: RNA methyltransferase [Smithella sp.]|nr:RNA methyltransferase [Smithella sp.]